MAKGNMLQGMARGKVGDVVFSRLDGEQISRVRNRHPHNPRTNSQLYQRAIMATVMQAYSAGKEIFDHAFEGYAVGAANQRRFLSLNAKKLRETIAAEIAAGTAVASQQGRVVAPGIKAPVAFLYQVSEGSLDSLMVENNHFPSPNENETISSYCSRNGIVANDIFTFVGFDVLTGNDPLFVVNGQSIDLAKQFPAKFIAIRMEVKESALLSTETLSYLGQLFEITKVINCSAPDLSTYAIDDIIGLEAFATSDNMQGSRTVIRSRKDEDLRSTSYMSLEGRDFGLATQFALAAWQQGTVLVGDSDLVLEGGDGGNVL